MLTAKQPAQYGYRNFHDIPTPPRTSPTLDRQDQALKPARNLSISYSPRLQSMSGSHRGLPPPPGMALPHPSPAAASHQPQPPMHPQALPPSAHGHPALAPSSQVPPEDSNNSWLLAKIEEEKRRQEEERRRQEEERTRQENLRLEQRKLEFDMLRTSLDRGIPPQLVPIVFAAMGGGQLPQAILEYAQSYIQGQPAHALPGLPGPPGPPSEHQRDPQYAMYAAGPAPAATTQGPSSGLQPGFIPYQGASSPPRQRAHTLSMGGPITRPRATSNLTRLQTEEQAGHGGGQPIPPYGRGGAPNPHAGSSHPEQSSSIYFHHWQPPASQSQPTQPEALTTGTFSMKFQNWSIL